jgi:asparagine synthase (glutamine-hydrolysing)
VCGFIGKISKSGIDNTQLEKANNNLICRGPDSTQRFSTLENNLNFSLIFNRLKIVDLSDKANQPMHLEDQTASIVFNGEIYNHKQLRKELESSGVKFTTNNSDTEVLLKGFKFFGKDFISKIRGQFAFCYIDYNLQTATLVSDRLNQKPLYYSIDDSSLIFSSNLRSLVALTKSFNLNDDYIIEYLLYGITSSPATIFEKIKKLEPAQIIEISLNGKSFNSKSNNYWNPENFVDAKQFNQDEFFDKFNDSVEIRAKADVSVAYFLSGGIDSTSIIKNRHDKGEEVNSFSVIFDEKKYSEEKWSREVAKKYSTNHMEINASSNLSTINIEAALNSLDEPYSDPSVFPSYLIADQISDYYKVAISGDGGDELLGGYKRSSITLNKKNVFSQLSSYGYKIYPPFLGTGNFFLSKSKNINTAYQSFFKDEKLLKLLKLSDKNIKKIINLDKNIDPYKAMLLQDYKYYLPEMMMYKVDRTSMANSLEIRSPFVDHHLVEYVLSTSLHENNLNINKNLLKNYLLPDFSKDFVNREKKGFVFDVENWVYNNLDYITEFLNEGIYFTKLPKNTLRQLSFYKTRINANRIWRLFVLEYYFSRL